ncbi:LPS export ABC transporter permease LptG [Sulfitobacter donghicola]|uniref:Permease n=1 Tax=Sulfitobacter donghicola DSW-25 = KCTC 12864 = JCM 14565 TaxID=1300350 RepID=A0A073IGZ7_9RHOB|nr:LPS export ABC transporter permease LptG [Sulfitobacter donghicola]KEJ89593.1 permease [Sulfitobacter donghicola DSW-25 = KCTC 12864 = JCM 14565]KIN69430.1 Permease, YjgP/YjgQ family [Sulfitobacter donghicola DSW-25 = KCTC 12864 = JCM 14565]
MILHLYFARRFGMSFLLITAVLFTLIALTGLLEETRQDYADSVSFGDIVTLTLLDVPQKINLILPLNMVLATVILFLNMARTSEMVVTRASGRSALKTLMSPVVVAFLIGLMVVGMFNPIVAATSKRYEQVSEGYRNGGASTLSISEEGLWLRQGTDQGQTVIRAWRSNNDGSVLYDVTFISYEPNGGPIRRIEAESAALGPDGWHLRNAKSWPLRVGTNAEGNAETHDSLALPSTLTLDRIRDSFGKAGAISIYELPAFINQLEFSGFSPRRHKVWLQVELARPLFLIAMVLVASAFTMRHTRSGGTGIAVLSAVLLGFGLYFIRSFAQILGENGQIPVLLAAWAPPIAAILLALGLILQREDG